MAKYPQSEIRNPKFQLALYPGDGIGPEVIDQAVRVLDRVQQLVGFAIEWQRLDWGYGHWQRHGRVVPEDFLDVLRPKDGILLGAVGWPQRSTRSSSSASRQAARDSPVVNTIWSTCLGRSPR